MADPLSLSSYIVQRKSGFGGLKLSFADAEGNQVLKSDGKAFVTEQPLQTMDGKVLSTVTHKIIAATPEYDIHAGGPKDPVKAVVKEPMKLFSSGGLNIEIKDASGNLIATATGNFLDRQISINDASGNALARVSRNLSASGVLGKLSQLALNSYRIDVTGTTVPTQTLLEFLVVLELLLARGQGANQGIVGGPLLGGLGGLGGFGGGGGGSSIQS